LKKSEQSKKEGEEEEHAQLDEVSTQVITEGESTVGLVPPNG
jgi:hypothetical protein